MGFRHVADCLPAALRAVIEEKDAGRSHNGRAPASEGEHPREEKFRCSPTVGNMDLRDHERPIETERTDATKAPAKSTGEEQQPSPARGRPVLRIVVDNGKREWVRNNTRIAPRGTHSRLALV